MIPPEVKQAAKIGRSKYMPVYIKDNIRDEEYMKKLIDSKLKYSLDIMSKDIQVKAKELEPTQYAKDTFAERLKRYIGISNE